MVTPNTTALLGVLAVLPSALVGYLGYRRAKAADAIAKQAGIATVESGTIGQVIDGLNKLVAALQIDNEVLRDNIDVLNAKLATIIGQCEELRGQLTEIKRNLTDRKGGLI